VEANGFNRQEVYNLYANPFNTTRPRVTFREREQFLLLNERFKDKTFIADLVGTIGFGGVELTSVSSYIDRDILVSRDASALTGSVSVDLGFPAAGVLLPSNLRDTTTLETFTQELRLGSTGSGPFQWVIGGFYSDVQRVYAQSLPTPGYDLFTDQRFGAGTAAGSRNGFPAVDSPFNSFLPYDIEQKAVFGEASYELGRLTATAGLRYYDFTEVRDIRFGGLFADPTNNVDETTSSDGVNPRFLLSYKASDNLTVNAQAAKGFRLGGVNDPLNLPLCDNGAPNGPDRATFGPFVGSFRDETLWNYELGFKSQFGGVTLNAAAFYTEIEDLQVTLDAGTCSSRIVFNVPEAHTKGLEFELSARPMADLDLAISGSIIEAEFDSTLTSSGAVIGGIREGNRLPSVPEFQISASASYRPEINASGTRALFLASFQHVGSRFTQPGDQENNPRRFVHGLPFGGQPAGSATTLDLKLPDYQLVNLSAGVSFPNQLELIAYVNNVWTRTRSCRSTANAADGRGSPSRSASREPTGSPRASASEAPSTGREGKAVTRVTRRSVLAAAASAMAAPALVRAQSLGSEGRVVVVGAGVFGAWTAEHLRRGGGKVLLLDAWGPAHARASSGGESRMTRAAYGKDEIYSAFAAESLAEWVRLSEKSELPLFHRIGVLFFFPKVEPYVTDTMTVHRKLGLPTQLLDAQTMRRRFPQFDFSGVEIGLYEPEFGALMARRAVQELVSSYVPTGGLYEQEAVLPPTGSGNRLTSVKTRSGRTIEADQFVFACGPWLPKLFPA
jgi:hypothetical protein